MRTKMAPTNTTLTVLGGGGYENVTEHFNDEIQCHITNIWAIVLLRGNLKTRNYQLSTVIR